VEQMAGNAGEVREQDIEAFVSGAVELCDSGFTEHCSNLKPTV
jgi:hypothetical protein